MDINNLPLEVTEALHVYYTRNVALPVLWKNRPSAYVGVRLLEGYEPRTLASGLTRHEAASWCYQDKWATPASWLWAQHRDQWPDAPETLNTQLVSIVRWLIRLNEEQRASFLRVKKVDGELTPVYGWSRLDELLPQDLMRGVEATFAMAEDRAALDKWQGPNELINPPQWIKHLPEGVELITTFLRLVEEGRDMRHCVATYASRIYKKESLIFSLQDSDGRRSTAEIVGTRVNQHEGVARRTPSEGCTTLLQRTLKVLSEERT